MPPSIVYETDSSGNIIHDDGKLIQTDNKINVVGPRMVTWIPNSAPPPAPSVLYVVPTFGWTRNADDKGNVSSWREGGGLRVYLDGPWNVTGYGEMLAIVLPPESFKDDPEHNPEDHPYKKYITQWGNDPIWLSPFVSAIAPKRTDFPLSRTGPDSDGKWLPRAAPVSEKDQPPADLSSGYWNVTTLPLPDTQPPPPQRTPAVQPLVRDPVLEVAPHDVFCDEHRQLLYCDIEINQGQAYHPFIRLALARYQPISISGAHLSNIVLADFMPLTPDRWVILTHSSDDRIYHVTVYGNTYADSSGHFEAKHSPGSMSIHDPITGETHMIIPADVSSTSVIEVWVEQLNDKLGEDFGWERITNTIIRRTQRDMKTLSQSSELAQQKQRAAKLLRMGQFDVIKRDDVINKIFWIQPLWDGDVTLPTIPQVGTRYRLVIAEYEEFLVDGKWPYIDTKKEPPQYKDRRLVFVEHVELG